MVCDLRRAGALCGRRYVGVAGHIESGERQEVVLCEQIAVLREQCFVKERRGAFPWAKPRFLTIAHALRSKAKDRKSTRLNSSHVAISYAVFCLKKKNTNKNTPTPARI